jgi:iron-sulfur cluster repair protein YtfE (RIC family)
MNVQSPVIRLESDHDDTSTVFETLRELTDGYAPKPDESAAYSALITGLATFEALLRHHIGLERYALFARICEKI